MCVDARTRRIRVAEAFELDDRVRVCEHMLHDATVKPVVDSARRREDGDGRCRQFVHRLNERDIVTISNAHLGRILPAGERTARPAACSKVDHAAPRVAVR